MAKSQKHRAGMVVSFTAFVSAGSGSAGEILFAVNGRGETLQEAKRDARRQARRRMASMSLTLLTAHESGPLPDCGGNESTPEGGTPADGGGGNGSTPTEGGGIDGGPQALVRELEGADRRKALRALGAIHGYRP